ncbi:PadR family transcriptional regulator [Embleya hyalina]|uniref:PadR family transcriptional regulator n=1 Tax=Embleya hyalina TaxID=516124 RepID=UPI001FE7FD7B|nr:PadR family transcriptional regulator [Embleya hyalina]
MRSHVLRLTAAGGSAHGASLLRSLTGLGYEVTGGVLYPTLRRMEAEELLVSEQRVVEGTIRRVYRVTARAEQVLAEERRLVMESVREALAAEPPSRATGSRAAGAVDDGAGAPAPSSEVARGELDPPGGKGGTSVSRVYTPRS